MEALTALPAELVAAADPTARAAAPLPRPAAPDGDAAAAPASFEACLALLVLPLPTGEPLPVAGKDLPPAPLASAAAPPPAATDSLAPQNGAATLARLALAGAGTAAGVPAELAPPPDAGAPPASQSAGDSPATAAAPFAAEAPTSAEPTFPLARDAAAIEATETAAQAALADAAEPQPGPEALAVPAEHASRVRKDAAAPRQPLAPHSVGAAPPPAGAVQPPADAAGAARNAVRHADLPEIAAPAGVTAADAPSAPRAEWLPSTQSSAASSQAPAATPAQVDVRAPDWQEAFANRVQVLIDHDVGEARITLHPPELGAVDIEISLVDDKTFVQLTTATAAARDELAQSLPRLRELLTVGGLTLGGASVHDGRGGERAPYGYDQAVPRSLAPLAELGFGADAPAASAARPRGRIDVFA